jgi:hypothetical protein
MRSIAAAVALALAFSLPAAAEGKKYGKGVGTAPEVKLVELAAHPEKYVGKAVRVEGRINDVCPMKGCWMDLVSDDKTQTIRVKVNDGEMVFPVDAKGNIATAEGVFTKVEMTKDQAVAHAKHLAEEKGQTWDPGSADVPTVYYQLKGTGVVIN